MTNPAQQGTLNDLLVQAHIIPKYTPCIEQWKTISMFQGLRGRVFDRRHIVDGRNPATQMRLVVYPIIYRVLMGFVHPSWCRSSSINSTYHVQIEFVLKMTTIALVCWVAIMPLECIHFWPTVQPPKFSKCGTPPACERWKKPLS